jgi:hypothetical protein
MGNIFAKLFITSNVIKDCVTARRYFEGTILAFLPVVERGRNESEQLYVWKYPLTSLLRGGHQ